MQLIYPPSSGGYAATFPLGGGRSRADGIRPYPVLQFLLWPPAAPIQNRFFMWGATTPARHGTTSQVRHPEAERSNPRPPSPDVPHTSICSASAAFPHRRGFYFGLCLTEIFVFRFFVEFLKADQVAFEQGMTLNMGQWLSIPFVIIGVYCMYFYGKRQKV